MTLPHRASLPPAHRFVGDEPTAGFVGELAGALLAAGPGLTTRGVQDVIDVVGRVGERFGDRSDPLRAEALDCLPQSSGLSAEMSRAVLDGMARDWTRARLERVVRLEFGDPDLLDRLVDDAGTRTMAIGPDLCVQVVSGSVPGVGVNALIRALLVKSPVLLKPGLGDVTLPVLFAEALREADPAMAEAVAVLYWPGGSDEVERAALERAEVVVAYGSDAAVKAIQTRTPVTARFVGYHHRISLAIVGRDATPRAATDLARATAMFDQRGCVSPQLVFVEDGGAFSPDAFAELLADEFRRLEGELPSATLGVEEAGALQQYRGLAEMRTATGTGRVLHGGAHSTWTVLLETEPADMPASPARALRVRAVPDAAHLAEVLAPMSRHLQTVGYAGMADRAGELASLLGRLGASRVTPLKEMAFPPAWWLHDGRGPLHDLVRWVELE